MQAVRCEACGNKALIAASSCPHCGHLFDLRDSFGELLPLTHCATCECDYPTRDGKCKWCGTGPQRRRIETSTLWRGAGVVAFVGMAVGVWVTRDVDAPPATIAASPNDTVRVPTLPAVVADTPILVAAAPIRAPVDTPALPVENASTDTTVVASADTAVVASTEPGDAFGPPPALKERPRATVAATPAVVVPPARGKSRTPARTTTPRWRNVVASDWVTVRAAPRHGARLLGSLGPDTRIQLGESREGWVRVRIRGMSGWVQAARLSTRPVRLARR